MLGGLGDAMPWVRLWVLRAANDNGTQCTRRGPSGEGADVSDHRVHTDALVLAGSYKDTKELKIGPCCRIGPVNRSSEEY